MNIKSIKTIVLFTISALLLSTVGRGQSAYSNLVMSLNPVAYWPLQETNQPPAYDMETNYGWIGSIADAYYASSQAQATNIAAVAGGGSRNFLGNSSSFAIVPTTDNRVSMRAASPFSVEAWVRTTGTQSYIAMVNQTGHNGNGGITGNNGSCGWMLCMNYSASWTDYNAVNGNHPPAWSFHVFNGVGDSGGAEAEVPNTNCLTGASGYVNSWVYLCGVFDGTNAWLYVYSTNLNNTMYGGTNGMNLAFPIFTGQPTAAGVPGPTVTNEFVPDTWDPIFFDCSRGYGANPYHGYLAEVAVYTNALTGLQISNHWAAGTNALANYPATILGDNPAMYWRMNSPKWTYPASSPFPSAANYGSAAAGMVNFNTGNRGANAGVYQPGTHPGAPGPKYAGFGSFTNACAFNGMAGAVDAGYNGLLDPTGVTNNFSLVAWFRGNPMDTYIGSRYNCLASHSDKSWKAQFQLNTTWGSKIGGGTSAKIAPTGSYPNDGNWHMYTLVSSYGPAGTNVSVYLDNGVNSTTIVYTNQIPGSNSIDAFIGGAPEGNYTQATNELGYNSSQQYFAGEVAHVAYFTNALTLNQVQQLYYTGNPAPTITQQPVSGNAGLNGAFTNLVAVAGDPPFYYQWYTNGVPIAGATTNIYIINPVLTSSGGGYYVVITNVYGSITSTVVNVTVVSNLTIYAQFPITHTNLMTFYGGTNILGTNYLGSSPTFSVSVVGATPISYQWLTNGVAVGGANSPSFTFANCQLGGPTNFSCVITNDFGSLTSMVWSASYIPTTTAPFPQLVLSYQPIGYWRLNEPDDGNFDGNPGAIGNDYQSGNNAIYTNVYLSGPSYNPLTDPTETSANFGLYASSASFAGSIGTNIDFSTPAGNNAEFSVAVWANGYNNAQPANAGLVTKGFFNGEEFNIDEGGTANSYGDDTLRLEVRDAAGGDHDAYSSVDLRHDPGWHYIVGVCDEANGVISLYVDGQLAGSATMPVQGGIYNSATVPVMIGARTDNTATGYLGDKQFFGYLSDVAIYNYALTASQVLGQYNGGGIPAYFVQEPVTSTNVDGGSTLVVPTIVGGSQPVTMQWFDGNGPIVGQTSNTLVIPNINANDTYYLMVSNNIQGVGYTANSVSVSVNVYNSKPVVTSDVQTPFYALVGQTATNSAQVYGESPLAYQWQFYSPAGWVNLSDNGRISGSLTSALTVGNVRGSDAGNYQLVITNMYGATTSSVASLLIPGVLPLTFGNGLGWTIGTGSTFANGVLTLTYGTTGNGTYFFQVPQYIGAFEASFTYQAQYDSTYPFADGITFCVQNDARGASATGSGGGSLGFSGITPSAALEMNIYPSYGAGYAFGEDGSIGTYVAPGSVNLTNGLVDVSILYANGQMSLTFSNELNAATFSTNVYVGSIPQALGTSTAYVGFTGAFGGSTSIQTVQNFKFVSIPPQAIQVIGNKAVIAWPGAVQGFSLQENSSITTTNWVNVPNATPILTNNLNEATVPWSSTSTNEYYRLILSNP